MICWRPLLTLLAALAPAGLPLAAQAPAAPSLDVVLERMDAYLKTYEGELGSLIADELFYQELPPQPGTGGRPYQTRRLDSEVAFLRLPDAEWLGFRRVKQVDGKAVDDSYEPLSKLLSLTKSDRRAQATLLVARSSEHNLGNHRTINLPNLPLELLQPRHRDRFDVGLDGRDRIRGRETLRLLFTERSSPSIVFFGDSVHLLSRMHVWVEVGTGALRHAHTTFEPQGGVRERPRLDVEFEDHQVLRMLVPVSMREEFFVQSGGLGKGRATYSNFRRFQTSARIVPPPQP